MAAASKALVLDRPELSRLPRHFACTGGVIRGLERLVSISTSPEFGILISFEHARMLDDRPLDETRQRTGLLFTAESHPPTQGASRSINLIVIDLQSAGRYLSLIIAAITVTNHLAQFLIENAGVNRLILAMPFWPCRESFRRGMEPCRSRRNYNVQPSE